eukprot:360025-Chlamydomonas_euryale.AAC.9
MGREGKGCEQGGWRAGCVMKAKDVNRAASARTSTGWPRTAGCRSACTVRSPLCETQPRPICPRSARRSMCGCVWGGGGRTHFTIRRAVGWGCVSGWVDWCVEEGRFMTGGWVLVIVWRVMTALSPSALGATTGCVI